MRILAASLAWTILCLASVVLLADTPSEALHSLLDESWQFTLREDPLFATRCGEHRYDDQLPAVSLDDSLRRNAVAQGFLNRLEEIDIAQLNRVDQINYAIFGRKLRDQLDEFHFRSHLMPISDRFGFHTSFPQLGKRIPLVTTADFENYIARLAAFDHFVTGNIELMREGLREGVTQPAVVFDHFREPLEAHIVDDAEESALFEPFQEMPTTVPESEHQRLREAGRQAIAESVVPGYARFLKFMKAEYVPGCRGSVGASGLPDGRDYYRYCTRHFTTLEITPEEVHAIGLREVKRIRGEMEALIQRVEFDGDLSAFNEHLRTNPTFYAKTEEELLMRTALILKRMDGRLPEIFGHLPRMPYGVQPIPAFIAPQATAAYYKRPTGDGTQAGTYFLNTYDLPSRPLYTSEALALHEAVPGHHLQIALQQELTDLPEFRKFHWVTAFGEGWALYAERLGLEVGFYEDPYDDYGRLTMEMWRACRLVVDTGLHYFGWTREKSIDYFAENSALPMHDIRAEVDRYIGWPGQALAYKMGELKIRELRSLAEEALDERFDLRSFHDMVLGSGCVPLDVLEENVKAWLAQQQSAVSK